MTSEITVKMSTATSVNSIDSSIESSPTLIQFLKYELIEKFHPVYFVGFLGCGITGNILYNFPYPAQWLEICGIIMLCITLLLFVITTTCFILSCCYHPQRIAWCHYDTNFSIFMGVYSMGIATIINAVHYLLHGKYPIFVWILWWIGVVIAVYNASFIFYFSFLSKLNSHKLQDINATLLIPMVCPCVISSSGNLVAMTLTNTNHRILTSITSLMLLCVSLVLFHGVGAIYMARLILKKIPNTGIIFTTFLPIGFLGQSSYSIMLFGVNMYDFIPDKNLANSLLFPCALFAICLLVGGFIFTFIAIISTLSKIKPFAKNLNSNYTKYGLIKWNKGYWTMTFPLGTMSLANIEISRCITVIPGGFELEFFKIFSCIYGVSVIIICLVNLIGMIYHIFRLIRNTFFIDVKQEIEEIVVMDKV